MGISHPFRIVYMLRIVFGQDLALFASCFLSLGAVATLVLWGRLADGVGNRSVFGISLGGMTACAVLWILVDNSTTGKVLAMVLFAAGGAFVSGNGIGQTRFMFATLKPELDAAYIASATLAISLALGVGSFVGGQILGLAERLDLAVKPQGGFNIYHIVFLLAAAMHMTAFYCRSRFKAPSEKPAREILSTMTRPLRDAFGPMIGWRPSVSTDDRNQTKDED